MRFAYVLPEPKTGAEWDGFDADLACAVEVGYDAVELQIADPAGIDEERLRESLGRAGLPLCAIQTGGTYASRGNCLCSASDAVRERTSALLRAFVNLGARLGAVVVFGSLQGRARDEPDLGAGRARIVEAMTNIAAYATLAGAVVAYEPVNHMEVAYHHTIAEVHDLVRRTGQPGLRMMVDTFHMNIEEADMLAPLRAIRGELAHVHLSETNRDCLGTGHWPTMPFLRELGRIGYEGVCSVGVYNTTVLRPECIRRCMGELDRAGG